MIRYVVHHKYLLTLHIEFSYSSPLLDYLSRDKIVTPSPPISVTKLRRHLRMKHPLLGDPPMDNASSFLLNLRSPAQWEMREVARKGELDSLLGSANNRAWCIANEYCNSDAIDHVIPHLHSIWMFYFFGARYTSHKSTEQDRLVLDILRLRGRGPLTRLSPGECGLDIARTPSGTVWNDLPYLAADMTEFWMKECGEMSRTQRLNVSTFLAKLASTRVANDQLCQIALPLFQRAFEKETPLGSTKEPDEEDQRRSMIGLSIADLLPSVHAWLREAGHNLILLSDLSWNDCTNNEIGELGYDLEQSEFGQRCVGGFSPFRWLFWLKQLHLIADEAVKADEASLAETAKEAIECMFHRVHERHSPIIQAFETASDAIKNDEHLQRLKDRFS